MVRVPSNRSLNVEDIEGSIPRKQVPVGNLLKKRKQQPRGNAALHMGRYGE